MIWGILGKNAEGRGPMGNHAIPKLGLTIMLVVALPAVACAGPTAAADQPLTTDQLVYGEAVVEFTVDVNGAAAAELIGGVLDAVAYTAHEHSAEISELSRAAGDKAVLIQAAQSLIDPTTDVVKSLTRVTWLVMRLGETVDPDEAVAYYHELMAARGWTDLATVRGGAERQIVALLAPGGKGVFAAAVLGDKAIAGMITARRPLGDLLGQIVESGSAVLPAFWAVRSTVEHRPRPRVRVRPEMVEPPPAAPVDCDLSVILEDGKPAAGARIAVFGAGDEDVTLTADPDGHATVENVVPPERMRVFAESADGSQHALVGLEVLDAGVHSRTMVLRPPGRFIGEVLDGEGRPAAGITVDVTPMVSLDGTAEPRTTVTDADGKYEVEGLIRELYYEIVAYRGAKEDPTDLWTVRSTSVPRRSGWFNVDIMLPQDELTMPRPEGRPIAEVVSGTWDEFLDDESGRWLPAVEVIDPYGSWARVGGRARWIWRVGRTSQEEERRGASVEFRRRFNLPEADGEVCGYLTISADDYAAIRLNGKWLGQCAEFLQSRRIAIPSEMLVEGENELRITLRNHKGAAWDWYNPGGVTYRLELIE